MDKKRLARIVKEEVQNLFEMRGRRELGGSRRPADPHGYEMGGSLRPAAPYGYGMGPHDSTRGKPDIDPFEAGTGDYRPRRPAGPPSLMGAGLSRTQGELFVLPKTGLFNIRLYDNNLDGVGSEAESKLFQMPEGGVVRVRIVNFSRQSDVEGTLEVKSVSEEGRNVLKGYEATIKMGGSEFTGEGPRAADAIAAADDARAAGSAEMGLGSVGPLSEARWAKLSGLNEAGPRIGAYGGEEPRGGYFKSGYRDPEGVDAPSDPEMPDYMTMSDRDFDRAVAKSAEIMAGGATGGPRTKTDVRGSGDVILSAEMSTNDMSYSGIKIPASIGERLGQADGDMVRVSNEIKMPGAALPGGVVGTGSTEIDGSGYGGGGYKVTGTNIGTAGGRAPRRSFVGTGGTIEDAYRAMLDKVIATYENARDREVPSDVRAIRQWASVGVPGGGMSSLSEARWGQLAGLMTEGRKSTGEKRLFASPPHDLDADEKALAREIGLDVKGDSVVGTMKQQRDFYERLAQRAKKTGPSSVPPFDKDAYERVGGSEEVDEGSGAAPGSDPKRLPKPPNPKKDGPPGKEDLDKIKNLGPFERKKR